MGGIPVGSGRQQAPRDVMEVSGGRKESPKREVRGHGRQHVAEALFG